MNPQAFTATFKVGDSVRVVGKHKFAGSTCKILGFPFIKAAIVRHPDGHEMVASADEVEAIPTKGSIGIQLDCFCECIKGKKDGLFTKGKAYRVISLYQDLEGDFLVEVVDNFGMTVQAWAKRFAIATAN